MYLSFSLILLFYSVNFVWTDAFYEDCGSKLSIVESFHITDCEQSPCELVIRNHYLFNVTFKALTSSTTATAAMFATVDGDTGEVKLPNPDLCSLDVKCPIKENDINTVVLSFPVPPSFPLIQFDMTLKIRADKAQGDFVCMRIPVVIKGKFDL